jgi:hypothetical protein
VANFPTKTFTHSAGKLVRAELFGGLSGSVADDGEDETSGHVGVKFEDITEADDHMFTKNPLGFGLQFDGDLFLRIQLHDFDCHTSAGNRKAS